MTSATPRLVQLDDLQVNVLDAGTGPPVLLLHGFPDSLALWRGVTPRLVAAGHRVIVPDLRGFGASHAPEGRRHYTMDAVLGDILALLERLGVREPVHAMGHDWGAAIAWCLSAAHPERVASSVVLSLGHPREYLLAGLGQKRKGSYTLLWQLPGIAEAHLSRNDWAGLRHWLRHHPDADNCVRDLARPGRLTAGLNWYRANLGRVVFGSWQQCRARTLGVWSSDDHCLAEDQMRNSARRMAAPWRYVRIDGAAHWLPLEQPERIAGLALDWFNEGSQ
jgi:pimeloyl-ACP methyl ester carboxylesterase